MNDVIKNREIQKQIFEEQSKILDDLQKAIMDAGGRLFSHCELRTMKIEDILNLTVPNSIKFRIKYVPFPPDIQI